MVKKTDNPEICGVPFIPLSGKSKLRSNFIPGFAIFTKKLPSDFKMKFHIHDPLEIVYILNGKGSYFVVDRIVNLEKGDCLIINNREIHRARIKKDNPFEVINLHFDKSIIENISLDKDFNPLSLFFKRNKKIKHKIKLIDNFRIEGELLLKKMTDEYKSNNIQSHVSIKLYLLELLHIIEKSKNSMPDKEQKDISSEAERVVKDIVDYINNNITKELTLTHLSKQAIFSPCYFSRIFKDVTGFSTREYINQKRILLAKELLQKEDIRIIDAAYEVGYKDISHFNFIFKKLTGISPFKYRKIYK